MAALNGIRLGKGQLGHTSAPSRSFPRAEGVLHPKLHLFLNVGVSSPFATRQMCGSLEASKNAGRGSLPESLAGLFSD